MNRASSMPLNSTALPSGVLTTLGCPSTRVVIPPIEARRSKVHVVGTGGDGFAATDGTWTSMAAATTAAATATFILPWSIRDLPSGCVRLPACMVRRQRVDDFGPRGHHLVFAA